MLPFELPRAGEDPPAPELAAGVAVQTLVTASDRNQLERMLLALAVHRDGVGFERAYWMRWDGSREQLHGRAMSDASRDETPLDQALDHARIPENRGSERAWQRRVASPAQLGEAVLEAWNGRGSAVGSGGPADTPWHEAPAVGVIRLDHEGAPFALLIGHWSHAADRNECRTTLEVVRRIANAALVSVTHGETLQRRARQAAAVAELARAASSPGNLGEVLQRVVTLAAQGLNARGGALWLVKPTEGVHLEVTHGVMGERERIGRALNALATAVIETARPRFVEQTTGEYLISPETAAQLAEVATVPLIAFDRCLGALALYARERAQPNASLGREEEDHAFLMTIAAQAALAVEHAMRFRDTAEAQHRATELKAEIARLDWMSSLGEHAARGAAETRQPLTSIQAFAHKVKDSLPVDDPRQDYIEIILAETDRLEHTLRASFEGLPAKAPSLRLEPINEMIHKVLQRESEALVRRRIRLVKKLAPDIPEMLLDPERIRHALGNMLASALDAVAVGGRIRCETRRVRNYVVVEIAHDGPCGAGGALEKVFEPFQSGASSNGALALGAVHRIVREHGGEVRVRAEGDWSTVMSFTLPIHENQDRRKASDRRQRGADRRDRFPER